MVVGTPKVDQERRGRTGTGAGRGRGRWRRLLIPTDLRGPGHELLLRKAQRVRLIIGLAFAAVMPITPGLPLADRLVMSAVVVAFLASVTLIEALPRWYPWVPAHMLTPLLGVLSVFAVTVALPHVMNTGLFTYIIGVTFYTCVAGFALGFWISIAAIPCAFVADALAPAKDRLGSFTLVMFAILLVCIAGIIDGLTRERRRTAAGLARLHEAMRSVTATPDLTATLDSIVESLDEAISATSGVLLVQGDHLMLAAPSEFAGNWTPEQVAEYTRRELETGDESPLARAVKSYETVVVPDIAQDSRFPEWSRTWSPPMQAFGFKSLVAVPLGISGDVIGVLNVCFTWPGGLEGDELVLLEAYAEQASLVIVRAQAYEHERTGAAQLAEADRLKTEFLAMVSHELRTPLTAVKGFVDTVLLHWDRLPDERRKNLLHRASGNADELARLVGQLLDFSRIDADRVELHPRLLALDDSVDAVLEDLAPVLSKHQLGVDVPQEITVVADPDAFGHVLVNLLTNAVKFSPADSCVAISACRAGEMVIVSVTDQGVGISAEEQEHIFERFYQSADHALSRRGTGIGLAIARRFAELHGGRVWCESTLGEGATFSFTLPAASATDLADGAASAAS